MIITQWWFNYNLPDWISPDLTQLILNSESMEEFEKQYWFDIYPSMDEDQISILQWILQYEKDILQELEDKYNKEIEKLNSFNKRIPLITENE